MPVLDIKTSSTIRMADTIREYLPKLVERMIVLEVRLEEINESLVEIHNEIKSDNEARRLEEMR